MYHIYFTGDDLARTKVAIPASMTAETLFAVELLARRGGAGYFAEWRRRAMNGMSDRARSLLAMARTIRPVPDMLAMIDQPQTGAHPQVGQHHRHLAAAVQDFYETAIAPYWDGITARLEADCSYRSRIILNGGVEKLLSTLHPTVTWSPPVLEVPATRSQDIASNGQGVVLLPSLFLRSRPVVINTPGNGRPPVVAYPIPLNPAATLSLWSPCDVNSVEALGALVGKTRATIVHVLSESCTTSELGRRIGISAAAASQHTTVLREAGLITTHRRMNTALHTLTPLGVAMLNPS
jgi:hypothetical protein